MRQTLSAAEEAEAHRYSYQLFGRLFLEPVTVELLAYLQEIPALAEVLPEPFDGDEAAASHYRLFSFNVYPHAAVFLDDSRLLGGPVTNGMAAFYQGAGFEADSAVEADHLGQAFAFLAYLAGRESAARSADEGSGWQRAQLEFLETQLLPWLVPCLVAVQAQEYKFYGRLAALALSLTASHYGQLVKLKGKGEMVSIPLPVVGERPGLEDGRTGLREISRYLITPVQSGFYLGRGDINRLGRAVSLPHGFGSREQMVRTLLEGAGQYELTERLLEALLGLVGRWQVRYGEIGQEFEEAAEFVGEWERRLGGTAVMLEEMRGRV